MKTCDLCGAPQEDALCESCDPFHGNRGKQFQAARRAVERVRKEAWEAGREAALVAVPKSYGRTREAIRALKAPTTAREVEHERPDGVAQVPGGSRSKKGGENG